jgi:UDPglucose--hexose-1-phosphate uridylyltransferase
MPELRRDPIVGRWVIISTERGKRPSDFGQIQPARKTGFCPFCAGNESKTPPEVFAYRDDGTLPDTPGWKVRVVSNKFPALQIEGNLDRRAEGIYDRMNGVGAHEVLIETPDHEAELSELPRAQIVLILQAMRTRIIDLAKDRRFRYIQIFKNHGEAAGASLEHSHVQLIATPIVPRRVVEELNGCASHFELKERCIVCDIVDQETEIQKRVVCQNEGFLCIEPFAPRFPFETWVLPMHHQSKFEEIDDERLAQFAEVLKESLQRINAALNKPPYNFVLHTSPCNDWKDTRTYHWHLEIMPKLTKVAGFEWGTGFYINPTPPESAAQFLREVSVNGGNGVPETKDGASEAKDGGTVVVKP